MKQLGLALFLLAPVTRVQDARLLGSGEVRIDVGAGGFSSEARISVLFTRGVAVGVSGPGIHFTIHRSNPNIAGLTEVLDESDGPNFLDAVKRLTNGLRGYVTTETLLPAAGGFASGTTEAGFFDFSGLACPNGIDFAGARIQRIELRVDSVFFGAGSGSQATVLELQGVLSVFGFDSTCDASAPEASVPGSVHAALEGDLPSRPSRARRAD